MLPNFGPVELILILVIVTMLFGVGKLPEVFGAVGRGIKEFRKNSADDDEQVGEAAEPAAAVPADSGAAPAEPAAETTSSPTTTETAQGSQ
jgi:sec-independent protein translocase protein TatA